MSQGVLHKCDGPDCAEQVEGDYPLSWMHVLVRRPVEGGGYFEVQSDFCPRCQGVCIGVHLRERVARAEQRALEAQQQRH